MLTVKNNRLESFDKIYLEELKFNAEELKKLMIDNPDIYIVSVSELCKNIEYLKKNNCTVEMIRKIFINNPHIINISSDEFNNIVKFN